MRHLYLVAAAGVAVAALFGYFNGYGWFFAASVSAVLILTILKASHPATYKEKGRQVVHLVYGIGLIYVTMVLGMQYALLLTLLTVLVMFLAGQMMGRKIHVPFLSKGVEHFEREKDKPFRGAMFYGIGCLAVIFIFYNHPHAVLAAVAVLAFGDSFSSGIGRLYGEHKIGDKSWEGTIAGFLAAYLVCRTIVPDTLAFLAAVVGTVVDLADLPVDDNLTIPLLVALSVTL